MRLVTLVSGGLDSTLVASLAAEQGATQFPLFIDYGQRARDRELAACKAAMKFLELSEPSVARVPGYGQLIRSGLTDASLDIVKDAFTPGRNALFLLLAGSYAITQGAESVAIGLLDERFRLFPDQSRQFIRVAEEFLQTSLGQGISIVAPLMQMSKSDVVKIAKQRNLLGRTYSCHAGESEPCGHCIACKEFEGTEA
jgi:7-cyano-7-deazaguanine synthase